MTRWCAKGMPPPASTWTSPCRASYGHARCNWPFWPCMVGEEKTVRCRACWRSWVFRIPVRESKPAPWAWIKL